MPSWAFGICVPPNILPLTHQQEREVFAATTPVAQEEVQKTLFLALFGIFAAAAEADHSTFVLSVDALQTTAWKAAEWQAHGTRLQDVATALRQAGARGIGLSSMGPTLFFGAQNFAPEELPKSLQGSVLTTRPRNCGRKVLVDGLVSA
jgi:beta-ribofuranosylaminobenzene 5'-phosphate synthase